MNENQNSQYVLNAENLNVSREFWCGGLGLNFGLNSRNLESLI